MTPPFPFRLVLILALSAAAVQANRRIVLHNHRGPVTDVSVSGDFVFSCSQAGVLKQSGDSLKLSPYIPFRVVALAPFQSRLLVAGGDPGESGKWTLMNPEDGSPGATHNLGEDLIYSVAVSGKTGFFALADGRVLQGNLEAPGENPILLHHEHTAPARSVRVSPDGRFLASGGMDRLVILSGLDRKSDRIAIQDHTAAVDCLAFSPDSSQIASGSRDGKVRIHAAPGGKLIRTYSDLGGEICTLAWGGKPERLLAGTANGKIFQLDLTNDTASVMESRDERWPIPPLFFGPDGKAFTATWRGSLPVKSPE